MRHGNLPKNDIGPGFQRNNKHRGNGNHGGDGSDHSQSNTDSGRMISAKVSGQREDDVHLGCREGSIFENSAPLAMGMVSSAKLMWWEEADVRQQTENNERSETVWNE